MFVHRKSNATNLLLFTNRLMRHGKKARAEKLLKGCLKVLRILSGGLNPVLIIAQAIANSSPAFQIHSCRVGSRVIRVPFPLTEYQQKSLSVKFLCEAAFKNSKGLNVSFETSLAREIYEAFNLRGEAFSRAAALNKSSTLQEAHVNSRWFLSF